MRPMPPDPLRTVNVTRYVLPLREGGSLPAIVEGDDDGQYVLKFRGAGQGPKALLAELVAGQIARRLGLPVPEIVLAELDPALADTEPDPEIQDLVRASGGTNVALDFLPGAFAYDPAVHPVDGELASAVVWFDALVSNLDRTRRNTNLLVWHRRLHLIDHGAALYFHHAPSPFVPRAREPFKLVGDHVLLPRADRIAALDATLAARLDSEFLAGLLAQVPDAWLADDPADAAAAADTRAAYVQYFTDRLQAPRAFALDAAHAHDRLA
jgi:hypothetical protein